MGYLSRFFSFRIWWYTLWKHVFMEENRLKRLLLLLFIPFLNISAQVLEQDSLALVALYDSTNGANWDNSWDLSQNVDEWVGIQVDNGRVTKIELQKNNLSGTIPPTIGDLSALRVLKLYRNNLYGSIPEQIGNCKKLTALVLYSNQLSGSIPTSIVGLTELLDLFLYKNKLSGTIPNDLGNLTKLTHLSFGVNELSGPIPESIGQLVHVGTLALQDNNFSGEIPQSVGNMTALTKFWAYRNNLTGAIPKAFKNCSNLQEIILSENALDSLPDFSTAQLVKLEVDENRLLFRDIEPNIGVNGFYYAHQDSIGMRATINEATGEAFIANVYAGGDSSQYQWFKNNVKIVGANSSILKLDTLKIEDAGNYSCIVKNSLAPQLVLFSRPIHLGVYQTVSLGDSLALRALYDSTGGENWMNNNWWHSKDMATWQGLTIQNNRVVQLSLPNSGLSGAIPHTFVNLEKLTYLNLAGNAISQLPNLTQMELNFVDLTNNNLDFESLEKNISISGLSYGFQDSIGSRIDTTVKEGATYKIYVEAAGDSNLYNWYKDGTKIEGEKATALTVQNITNSDAGRYYCVVTNKVVTGLELTTRPVIISVEKVNAIAKVAHQPFMFNLKQNYPNPFNPQTRIDFVLEKQQDITLALYNLLGQRVQVLAKGPFEQGAHSVLLNADNLASGTYIYRLQTPKKTLVRQLHIIK